jgi:hypothetical protein
MSPPQRILVVANRTAAAPRLLDEIARRADAAPCSFTLLIPDPPDRRTADWTLEIALPLLQRAARGPVESVIGELDAFASVEAAVRTGDFDEIIVSTLPRRFSRWLRRDLITRVAELGLPVTAIVPRRERARVTEELVLDTPPGMGGNP